MKYEAGDLPASNNAGSVFYPMLYCTLLYYVNVHPIVANYLAEVKTNLSTFYDTKSESVLQNRK